MHVYLRITDKTIMSDIQSIEPFHVKHNGLCAQCITSNYNNEYIQVAYCGGRFAKLLQRYRLFNYEKFLSIVRKDLLRVFLNYFNRKKYQKMLFITWLVEKIFRYAILIMPCINGYRLIR